MYAVKEMRLKRNMTQAELAQRSNVSRATINKLDNTQNFCCKTSTLRKIAEVLECSVDELLSEEE